MKRRFLKVLAAILAASLLTAASPASAIEPTSGYDISYPQCNSVLPTDGAFKIVGINGGLVYSGNPCLDEQIIWAGGTAAQFYINTGNLGPTSGYWPLDQTTPMLCDSADADSTGCAFNYGYNAAKDSYQRAVDAYARLGITASPALTTWWLDVETSNSWRGADWVESTPALTGTEATSRNVASIAGATHYLQSVAKITKLGVYSTPYQWSVITGGSKLFSDLVSWHALGESTHQAATDACTGASGFTGAPIVMTQYIDTSINLDVNVTCSAKVKVITSLTNTSTSTVKRGSYFYLKGTLKTAFGATMANRSVTFKFAGKTYKATTSQSGYVSVRIKAPTYAGKLKAGVYFWGNYYLTADSSFKTVTVK